MNKLPVVDFVVKHNWILVRGLSQPERTCKNLLLVIFRALETGVAAELLKTVNS